ncbi:MAG: DNA polymerase III subunit gamma/tau [Lentisphaeria bacterium]|nr:DNA polymerase III subunit gamma/tau [Lentisphaeria bacterium]NQZ69748.1 DNA polymerase III subunit gamma/tau [Lentisphaeria bacterium]
MAYQVLARKWRPQIFADVLGQEHITRTLQNAITQNRIGQAYLFVGPRGTGKTTSARIFAKALNCENPQTTDSGIEPCCDCNTCTEIAAGNCLDVWEIDGASHNKVEDIRELCENVQYSPSNGRKYKIYIIDEVHMLTTQAWNALLKTLEEPPEHVKFLFATTEPHKVLATILSRTQRFDLKRISVNVIVKRLREIATAETINISDNALTLIARAAEGGMRDAQSIFDQMIAFCNGDGSGQIEETDVIDVFGLSSQSELANIQSAMIENQSGNLITALHHLADNGRDLEKLYADVLLGLRNIMIFQIVDEPAKVLDMSDSEAEELSAISQLGSERLLQTLVEGLLKYGDGIRHTLNKRVFLEVTFLKVMQDAHAPDLDTVIKQMKAFKEGNPDLLIAEKKTTETVSPTPLAAPIKEEVSEVKAPEPEPAPATEAPVVKESVPKEELEKAPKPVNYSEAEPAEKVTAKKTETTEYDTSVWKKIQDEPFVKKLEETFQGRLIDVRGSKEKGD